MPIKGHNVKDAVFALCTGVYFCLVLPLTTYVLFQDSFSFDLAEFTTSIAILFILVSIGIFLFLCLLPFKLSNLTAAVILLIVILSYYNFNFSDYQGKIIDADSDVLNHDYHLFEYSLFIVFAACAIFFSRYLSKYLLAIISIILVMSISGLIVSWMQSDKTSRATSANIGVDDGFYKLSNDKNVVHIILDGMQGSVFSQILEQQPDISRQFEGFSFFPDALTATEITYLAIPAILTGEAFNGEGSITEYRKSAGMLKQDDMTEEFGPGLMTHLHNAGFFLDILSPPGGGMEKLPLYTRYYYSDFEIQDSASTSIKRLLDLTLVKALPWTGKRAIYRDGSWFFSKENKTDLPRANRAMNFITKFGDNAEINNQAATYKMLHLLTPHGPFTTSKNCTTKLAETGSKAAFEQSLCTLHAITKFLDKLKSIGAYANSLIIINGDHGICNQFNMPDAGDNKNLPSCIGNVNPLVLIKPPEKTGELVTNNKQVELTDLPATILDTLLIPHDVPGISMLASQSTTPRTRTFFQFKPNRILASKLDRVDVVDQFEVKGTIFDMDAWAKISMDQSIDFDNLETGQILNIDKTGHSDKAAWVRWKGQAPEKHIYAQYDNERITLKIGEGFFSFKLPDRYPEGKLFLVDPVKGLKQEIKIN